MFYTVAITFSGFLRMMFPLKPYELPAKFNVLHDFAMDM